jgi:hypothetical protein
MMFGTTARISRVPEVRYWTGRFLVWYQITEVVARIERRGSQ